MEKGSVNLYSLKGGYSVACFEWCWGQHFIYIMDPDDMSKCWKPGLQKKLENSIVLSRKSSRLLTSVRYNGD
ncbi:MAG: hypothetical protein ACLFPF_01635 [Halanaerobiales bacterium]